MLNLRQLAIDYLVDALDSSYRQNYGDLSPSWRETVVWCGQLALENIANSDALYHNVEHTVMVTLVGQSIIQGKHLLEGGVTPESWLHYMMALLCHDIGFVKGVCRGDRGNTIATGVGDELTTMPPGSTDAALAPFHVDRGKLFIRERFAQTLFIPIDVDVIGHYIELTRFPIPGSPEYQVTNDYGGLVRAADFIGQLADPNYLRKLPALYYELEEVDSAHKIGYKCLEDMRQNYGRFYWEEVNPYIQDALRYLRVTQEGKQWIANLHSHIFDIEHSKSS